MATRPAELTGWVGRRRMAGLFVAPAVVVVVAIGAYSAGWSGSDQPVGGPASAHERATPTSEGVVVTGIAPVAPEPGGGTSAPTATTSVPFTGAVLGDLTDPEQRVALRIESRVNDVTTSELETEVLAWLNHDAGWARAGFTFTVSAASPFLVVLAEGDEVDELCLPLETFGSVSCQNGPVVALNADRWRLAVDHWDSTVADYRGYLVNHEVGHLLGQRHPKPRCPVPGRPAGVMEQQTGGLKGCTGNPLPRDWEIELARRRPAVYAPLPDWGPDPVPANGER